MSYNFINDAGKNLTSAAKALSDKLFGTSKRRAFSAPRYKMAIDTTNEPTDEVPSTLPEMGFPDEIPGQLGEDEMSNNALRTLAINSGTQGEGSGFGLLDLVQGLGESWSPEAGMARGDVLKQNVDTAEKLVKSKALKDRTSGKNSMPAVPAKMMRDFSTLYTDILDGRKATAIIKNWLIQRKGGGRTFDPGASNFWNNIIDRWKNVTKIRHPDQAAFERAYNSQVNAYIKNMTGAQLSAHEADRLMKAMPSSGDSADSFMVVWDDIMMQRENKFKQHVNIAQKAGYRGIHAFNDAFIDVSSNPHKRTSWRKAKPFGDPKAKTKPKPKKRKLSRREQNKAKARAYTNKRRK